MKMKTAEFIGHVEALLELNPGALQSSTKLADLPEWDSLAVMGFIAMMDTKFSMIVNVESISGATSVGDLVRLAGANIEA